MPFHSLSAITLLTVLAGAPAPSPKNQEAKMFEPDKSLGGLRVREIASQEFPPDITASHIREAIGIYEDEMAAASKRSAAALLHWMIFIILTMETIPSTC